MNTPIFQIAALPMQPFAHLFALSDAELEKQNIKRMTVTQTPGFPCRVSLQDGVIGEEVLLLHYLHHDVKSPYRASGPIYIRKAAVQAMPAVNEIPTLLLQRTLSLHAYSNAAMLLAAKIVKGVQLAEALAMLFENAEIAYVHIHNAGPGCYSCCALRL